MANRPGRNEEWLLTFVNLQNYSKISMFRAIAKHVVDRYNRFKVHSTVLYNHFSG